MDRQVFFALSMTTSLIIGGLACDSRWFSISGKDDASNDADDAAGTDADDSAVGDTDHAPVNDSDHAPVSDTDHAPVSDTDHAPVSDTDHAPVNDSDHVPVNDTDDAAGDDDDGTIVGTMDPNPHCASYNNIADNLELAQTLIPMNGPEGHVRQGAWYTYNDGTSGATQDPPAMDPTRPFMPTHFDKAVGLYAARMTGRGFRNWGAGFGFDLNNAACLQDEYGVNDDPECPVGIRMPYDASIYRGISFYAKQSDVYSATVSVTFRLPTMAETPVAEAGSCVDDCSDSYSFEVDFGHEWTLHEIMFEDLAQVGFGDEVALDLTKVLGLQWQVGRDLPSFDIAVDEVCFITE